MVKSIWDKCQVMNKSILLVLLVGALIVPSTVFADSYQHFRNDSPFNVKMSPHETLFINNNVGKVNQLTVMFPNGTSKITDSNVGNNGATNIQLNDVGQYTFFGSDGVIGYAVVAEPEIPPSQVPAGPVIIASPQAAPVQNVTPTNQTTQNTPVQNIPVQTTSSTPIVTFSFSNQTTPIQTTTSSVQTSQPTVSSTTQDSTISERLDSLEKTNKALSDKIDVLEAQQLGIFGLITKIAHSLGITGT